LVRAAEKAIGESPVKGDPKFAALRAARPGKPVQVRTSEGEEAYWLVPLLIGDKACGFVQVERDLRVSRVGIFGASPEDRGSWIGASFFEKPPLEAINSIKARYPGMRMSAPFFSYDRSPSKWGWMVRLRDGGQITVFINPAGWYERSATDAGLEG
jgi:hypothetical protein